MQTNITQNVSLYTEHVINIFLENYLQHYILWTFRWEQNLLSAKVKKFWLSSSVLNSLASSYPFTFRLRIRFAYKQHLRKHSPALLQTCFPCPEKTKGGHKEICKLQFKSMTVIPTYLVSKYPRVLKLQANPAIPAEWHSDRWGAPGMKHRGKGPCMTTEHWLYDIEGALDCRPGLLRTKLNAFWTMGYRWVGGATSAQMLDEKGRGGKPRCSQVLSICRRWQVTLLGVSRLWLS